MIYKASKCEWPWIRPLKITQGKMWWYHWNHHTWFPIDIYSNHMCNFHHLALKATQNVFTQSLIVRPRLRKIASAPNDLKNDLERKKAKGTPYMLNNYPRVPHFTPFSSLIARFPDNWGVLFLHGLQWWICYFRKKKY